MDELDKSGDDKMIFELIDVILKENGYEKINIEDSIGNIIQGLAENNKRIVYNLYVPRNKNHVQYILLIDAYKSSIDKIRMILDLQIDIYTILKNCKSILPPEFDKNVSLLLCLNCDIEKDNNMEKEILKLEENPYCFKKLVITYKDNEVGDFIESIGDKLNIWEYMKDRISEIKKGEEIDFDDSKMKLILQLFIKMPFIPIDIVREHEKEDLIVILTNTIQVAGKTKIWNEIQDMELDKISQIKDSTEEEIDKILDAWYVKEV